MTIKNRISIEHVFQEISVKNKSLSLSTLILRKQISWRVTGITANNFIYVCCVIAQPLRARSYQD